MSTMNEVDVTPRGLIRRLESYAKRTRSTNVELAKLFGVTEGAVRRWRKVKFAPKSGTARVAIATKLREIGA